MHHSFLALGRIAVFATNDSWRKKFQIPSSKSQAILNFQNPNRAEATAVVRHRLLAWEFSPLEFPWSLGFGIWNFLILN
jgi:hypothetical protein